MAQFYILNSRLKPIRDKLLSSGITYGLGSKAPLNADVATIRKLDCSGFVRYLLYHATDRQLTMPDGSWNQRQWCQRLGLEAVNYSTAGECDSWLRIAFINPKAKRAGHVWLIRSGLTLESHGRTTGPNQRLWDTPVLVDHVAYCYKFALITELEMCPVYWPAPSDYCLCE